jgi:hypothetical protein
MDLIPWVKFSLSSARLSVRITQLQGNDHRRQGRFALYFQGRRGGQVLEIKIDREGERIIKLKQPVRFLTGSFRFFSGRGRAGEGAYGISGKGPKVVALLVFQLAPGL